MFHLIHKDYNEKPILLKEEAENLYLAIKACGKDQIIDAAYNMYSRDETPLDKNWDDFNEFSLCFDFFYELSNKLEQKEFVQLLLSAEQGPIKKHTKIFEHKLIKTEQRMLTEACALLGFLDTLSDYLDYEITLRSLGYGCDHKKRKSMS